MATSNLIDQDFASEEEDDDFQGGNASGEDVDAEGEPDDEAPEEPVSGKGGGQGHGGGDEEEDEEDEDEDEDEDEEDEEDEEDDMPQRKRPRRIRNQFLDVEAEVDEDEEDIEEEEDDRAEDGFIQDDAEQADISDFRGFPRDDHRHRELDRQHEQEQTEDMEAIAAGFKARHGKSARRRMGDSEIVPRRLLLPSVNDPSIWGVKCRPGKEREVIFAILRKQEELRNTRSPLNITSAFERGNTMSGYIYVEAKKQTDVLTALQGISNVYPMSKMILVPIKEMPDLLYVVKKAEITPGTWVRFKRGKYQGDLAQVENVLASGLEVRIRMVPRLDYGNTSDLNALDDGAPSSVKRKRAALAANSVANRPPQRLFSEQEAKRNHAKYLANNSGGGRKNFTYLGEEYEDGYLVKDVKLTQVTTENVNPTLEEVAKFASGADDGTESLDLNALAQSLRNSVSTYQPGDTIEVYDGEQQGVVGKAVSVHNDIVTMDVIEGDLKGRRIEVPFKGLRKKFREGDHVKVTGGSRFRDEVGMVVKIVQDRVTILSDLNMQEITVFSKDLREASDTGIGNPAGRYDLHDLIQLDMSTVACVVKVDRESLRVLDQNGNVRVIVPSQVSTKIANRRHGVATDRNGSEIRVGDTVKETGGETRTGIILHIYRAFAFLHNREQTENAGVFVCKTNNIATIAAKGGRITNNAGPDLTKMNPALQRNGGQNQMMPPPLKVGGRDKCIGQTITIRQGPYKGLMGIIKDATDSSARVELHTKNKTITIEKAKLGFRDATTGAIKTYQEFIRPGGGRGDGRDRSSMGFNGNPSGMPSGSRTPQIDYSTGSRTPAWMGAGNRTPAWMNNSDGGRTPAYNSGGKTPAWGMDGSRTSYGGGNRTPAWNPSSRTPFIGESERSAWDAGSKTPGRQTFNDFDSSRDHSKDSYSARTPGAYSASSPEFSAQNFNPGKEFSAPTPGGLMSAPTPSGAMSAPTPGPVSAPTPRDGYGSGWGGADTAPTPAPYGAAPTPGASGIGRDPRAGYYGAPTPAGGNPRTPGVWGEEEE